MDVKFEKIGFDFLGDLWGKKIVDTKMPTLEEIYQSQWSDEFEKLMRNRLAMGYFRYGALSKQKKGEYDNISSIIARLMMYKKTGNLEYLVDSANICMVEYLNGNHPKRHFHSVDDGIHTEKS